MIHDKFFLKYVSVEIQDEVPLFEEEEEEERNAFS